MLFTTLCLTLLITTLTAALPLEDVPTPRNLAARAKTYAIVNVDGGTTTASPPESTTTVKEKTKTVEVTDEVTATATMTAAPAPTSDKSSSTSTPITSPRSTLSEQSKGTPSPSVVTVIVTESAAPTEYYDDGLWKTSYAIKTFETVTTTASAALPTHP